MEDTKIKLSQCRCGAFVFACRVNGYAVSADITPLGDQAQVFAALAARRSVYEVRTVAGAPSKLKPLGGQGTSWEPADRHLVADHISCGSSARANVPVEMPQERPQRAPVRLGRPWDGFHPQPALESGSQGRTAIPQGQRAGSSATPPPRAARATRPRFDRQLGCDECGRRILPGEPYVSIEHFRYTWAVHDFDCTSQRDKKLSGHSKQLKEVGLDAATELWKKDMAARKIEDVELPDDGESNPL